MGLSHGFYFASGYPRTLFLSHIPLSLDCFVRLCLRRFRSLVSFPIRFSVSQYQYNSLCPFALSLCPSINQLFPSKIFRGLVAQSFWFFFHICTCPFAFTSTYLKNAPLYLTSSILPCYTTFVLSIRHSIFATHTVQHLSGPPSPRRCIIWFFCFSAVGPSVNFLLCTSVPLSFNLSSVTFCCLFVHPQHSSFFFLFFFRFLFSVLFPLKLLFCAHAAHRALAFCPPFSSKHLRQ